MHRYESIATVGEIRVYWRADFQSGSRVLKKLFWTLSYLYLWHTMWFHAKKLLKTLKFWKSLNSLCKSGSRPQKSPKKAQKTDHSIAIYSNFWIGMVYFGCHLVNPHEYVWQRGVESLQGRVTASRSWPLFREKKNHLRRCYQKLAGHNFDRRAKSSWEKIFNIYKNFLSGGFRSKIKIVTAGLFVTPPYFCWQLAFHRHLPTSGRQNRVKNLLYPPFIYIFWILSA